MDNARDYAERRLTLPVRLHGKDRQSQGSKHSPHVSLAPRLSNAVHPHDRPKRLRKIARGKMLPHECVYAVRTHRAHNLPNRRIGLAARGEGWAWGLQLPLPRGARLSGGSICIIIIIINSSSNMRNQPSTRLPGHNLSSE